MLLVADDETTKAVLTDFLQAAGYTVLTAPHGQLALEQLRMHPVGLVVMVEFLVPGRDDAAFLQAIVADSRLTTQHAYILLPATTRTLPKKMVQLLQHLNVSSIPKPLEREKVLAAVARAASQLL